MCGSNVNVQKLSIIFSSEVLTLCYHNESSVFHPKRGAPIPLDVFAGVSCKGECPTEDGPTIKVYLQKHPWENRLITVITFENHLSCRYRNECRNGIMDMQFQDLVHSNSYLRVATTEMPPGHPNPYLTFGNQQSSLRFYEATDRMVNLERDV